MTRDEAERWKEALYGKRATSKPDFAPQPTEPKVVEPKPIPTNIIYVPADVWRRYPSKKSA